MPSKRILPYMLLLLVSGLAGTALAASAGDSATDADETLPSILGEESLDPGIEASREPASHDVPDEAESGKGFQPIELPILANEQILAFYGHPFSKSMGILGEYPKEELGRLLKGYCSLYDAANGERGIVPAFYLIYGTCWPGGEIGFLKSSTVEEYIQYAASQGMLVFLDHQIGKYPVAEAMKELLQFVRYPNVHFALDPEWRTSSPMVEIGAVTADELNEAQALLDARLSAEGLPGRRMLVVHQFRDKMIQGRNEVRADFPRVLLVHTADGFGPPSLKKQAYAANAAASNIPLKGFKLFLKTQVVGAGYDEPLLTPPEVLALDPQPSLIIYQ